MRFTPMTDEQIEATRRTLGAGEYDFQIIKATQKLSASGNEMIEIHLKIFDQNGNEYVVYDWLMPIPNMMWKLKHFCECTNLTNTYESGVIEPFMLQGKSGKVRLKIQKQDGKDYTRVDDYLPKELNFEDSIPF